MLKCYKCGGIKSILTDGKTSHNSSFLTEGRVKYSWINSEPASDYPFEKIENHIWQSTNQGKDSTESIGKWGITVDKETTISIPYSVSSELNFDKLSIILDNNSIITPISGEQNGICTTTLGIGTHTLEAKYKKDSSGCSYNDNGQIILCETICEECGHVHDFTINEVSELSLTTEGIIDYTCNICNTVFREITPIANYSIKYTTTSNSTEQTKYFITFDEIKTFIKKESLKTVSLENKPSDTDNIDCSNLFAGLNSLTSIDLSKFYTKNVTNMNSMFYDCIKLQKLDLSNFNTSNVTYMEYMFTNCASLTSLDLQSFNTSNVINMEYMFYGCSSLTSLDVSNFNTSNVTSMRAMFDSCHALLELDLSSFDTSNVTIMNTMFRLCSNLTTILVSEKWNTDNITGNNGKDMFISCVNLKGAISYTANSNDYTFANTTTGYLTLK